MRLDNLFGDRKTQARTARGSRALVVRLVELVKDTRQLLGRDARARVVHLDVHRVID